MRSVSSPRAVSMMIGTWERSRSAAGDVVAGAVGEHHVEEHEVGHLLPGPFDRLGDGAGHLRVEALAIEGFGQGDGDGLLVLDHQDGAPARHRGDG